MKCGITYTFVWNFVLYRGVIFKFLGRDKRPFSLSASLGSVVSVLGCSSIIFFITLGKSLNTCISFKPKLGAKCWNLPVNSAFFTDLRSCLSKKEIARLINIMCSGINSLQKFHVRYNGIKLPILIQVHSWFKKRRCCLNIKKGSERF